MSVYKLKQNSEQQEDFLKAYAWDSFTWNFTISTSGIISPQVFVFKIKTALGGIWFVKIQ